MLWRLWTTVLTVSGTALQGCPKSCCGGAVHSHVVCRVLSYITEEALTGADQLSGIVGQVSLYRHATDAQLCSPLDCKCSLGSSLNHGGSAGQEVSRAMLQQMQHVQHAGADLTAEELRFSTSDLLQALKVSLYQGLCLKA